MFTPARARVGDNSVIQVNKIPPNTLIQNTNKLPLTADRKPKRPAYSLKKKKQARKTKEKALQAFCSD